MKSLYLQILDECYENAKGVLEAVEEKNVENIVSTILKAKKIYILGIGHSGMFGKIFAMKLNHVGLRAYTVFDEINPPFEKNDLFIAISQSGETSTIISIAQKAKKLGGKVIGITSVSESTLGRISDLLLKLDKYAEGVKFSALSAIGDTKNQNLLGLLFGLNIYTLFYSIIIMIANEKGETPDSINSRHANLQ
jgi:6-phospho-3-hexuloisomerase